MGASFFDSVLMLFVKNYQNWSVPVEAIACQSWHVLRHSVVINVTRSRGEHVSQSPTEVE